MFINVVAMGMVEMPVMQIIDVTVMADGYMPAAGPMNMCMIAMLRIGTCCHDHLCCSCRLRAL